MQVTISILPCQSTSLEPNAAIWGLSIEERITDEDRGAGERMRPLVERIAAEAEQYLVEHFNLVTSGTMQLQTDFRIGSNYVQRLCFIGTHANGIQQLRREDLKELTAELAKLYRMYGRNRETVPLAIQLHAAVSATSSFAMFEFAIPD